MNENYRDKILEILNSKNIDPETENHDNLRLIDQLETLCNKLSPSHKDLILTVLESIEVFSFDHYPSLLKKAVSSFKQINLVGKHIIFSSADRKKSVSSSSTVLVPLLKNEIPKLQKHMGFLSFQYKIEPENHNFEKEPTYIFLVDDFIGSGGQVTKTIELVNPVLRPIDQIHIFTLVAGEKAIAALSAQGVPLQYGHVHKMGIESNSKFTNKDQAKMAMKEIEGLLKKFNPIYSLGYSQSESVISLINTPNNTFPVFWHEEDALGGKWPNAFSRKNLK